MSRTVRLSSAVAILAGIGIAAVWLVSVHAGEPAKAQPGKEAAKVPPGGIKVSRETTFITEPLRKDGTVDYLAALNQRFSRGVTPENNAAVLFLQAMGPGEINKDIRERFFKMLGIAPLPEKGPYLEEFTKYFERKHPGGAAAKDSQQPDAAEMAFKQYEQIMDRPWSKQEFPIAAAWLAENQKQIDLIVAATKCPRYYVPLVTGRDEPGMFIGVLLPPVHQLREAARDLLARAMFRMGSGKVEEAWQDLLACHRLARLVGQGPTLIDLLVGIAIEETAMRGDAVLAHEGKLTAEQARRFAAEFRQLPLMGRMVDRINWAERFMYLDCVYAVAGKGLGDEALDSGSGARQRALGAMTLSLRNLFIDWNEPMRMGNQWYDRLVAGMSNPNRKERDAAVAEFERDLKKVDATAKDPRVALGNISSAGSLRGGLGRQMGHVFIALLMPALTAVVNAEDRAVTSEGMVQVVFTLAAYRADHGSYPADLAALVPKYLPAIPEDLFSGGPVRYKREGAGYVVYSVGINRKDDGGRSRWDDPDAEDAEGCDDYAIRVPAKKK